MAEKTNIGAEKTNIRPKIFPPAAGWNQQRSAGIPADNRVELSNVKNAVNTSPGKPSESVNFYTFLKLQMWPLNPNRVWGKGRDWRGGVND